MEDRPARWPVAADNKIGEAPALIRLGFPNCAKIH